MGLAEKGTERILALRISGTDVKLSSAFGLGMSFSDVKELLGSYDGPSSPRMVTIDGQH